MEASGTSFLNTWLSVDCGLWVVTPCGLVGGYQRFYEKRVVSILRVKVEAICFNGHRHLFLTRSVEL
jgi:hypothetical protein